MSIHGASIQNNRLKKRYGADRRFRIWCGLSVWVVVIFLAVLFFGIGREARFAFWKTEIALDIPQSFSGDLPSMMGAGLALDGRGISPNQGASDLLSPGSIKVFDAVPPVLPARVWVPAADDVNHFFSKKSNRHLVEADRRLTDGQVDYLDKLTQKGRVRQVFNYRFWTEGDARDPEFAGIHGAFWGSLYLLFVTFLIALPIGVGAAIYLEECAPSGFFFRLIDVSVSNLAAVPSIVFGLLGLAIFLNVAHLPRSSPLVGGMTLALMTLPTLIITARSALKSVPPSIRMAALALGASPIQMIFHHVLPMAFPGIVTGVLISIARAMGETAPLLMVGMMAYVPGGASGFLSPSSALPVQIFAWARNPEPGFMGHAAAGILVLLGLLIFFNSLALWVRRTFDHRV